MPSFSTRSSAYQPSKLSVSYTPDIPLPVTPTCLPRPDRTGNAGTQISTTRNRPPPNLPLYWLWQCHLCRLKYPLGATRRCLEDGHHFCSGAPPPTGSRRRRTNRRHGDCTSEFDYQGWQSWGEWRRADLPPQTRSIPIPGSAFVPTPKPLKDCWARCDYPSECRWSLKGIRKPDAPSTASDTEEDAVSSTESDDDQTASVEEPETVEDSQKIDRTPTASRSDLWSVVVASLTGRAKRKASLTMCAIVEGEEDQDDQEDILSTPFALDFPMLEKDPANLEQLTEEDEAIAEMILKLRDDDSKQEHFF